MSSNKVIRNSEGKVVGRLPDAKVLLPKKEGKMPVFDKEGRQISGDAAPVVPVVKVLDQSGNLIAEDFDLHGFRRFSLKAADAFPANPTVTKEGNPETFVYKIPNAGPVTPSTAATILFFKWMDANKNARREPEAFFSAASTQQLSFRQIVQIVAICEALKVKPAFVFRDIKKYAIHKLEEELEPQGCGLLPETLEALHKYLPERHHFTREALFLLTGRYLRKEGSEEESWVLESFSNHPQLGPQIDAQWKSNKHHVEEAKKAEQAAENAKGTNWTAEKGKQGAKPAAK